jgi:hypothetical protein
VACVLAGLTYGVAKNVSLVPVRVMDCHGNARTSDLLQVRFCLSVHLSDLLQVRICLSVHLSDPLLVHTCLTIVTAIDPSDLLRVHICLSVCPSVCLSVCLSVAGAYLSAKLSGLPNHLHPSISRRYALSICLSSIMGSLDCLSALSFLANQGCLSFCQGLEWISQNCVTPGLVSISVAGEQSAAVNEAVENLITSCGLQV